MHHSRYISWEKVQSYFPNFSVSYFYLFKAAFDKFIALFILFLKFGNKFCTFLRMSIKKKQKIERHFPIFLTPNFRAEKKLFTFNLILCLKRKFSFRTRSFE